MPIDTANCLEVTSDAKVVSYSKLYDGYSNQLPSLSIRLVLFIFGSGAKIMRLALFIRYTWIKYQKSVFSVLCSFSSLCRSSIEIIPICVSLVTS